MKAIKGFDANLQCRGFQFEVGKTYTHEGDVKACEGGFHAIPEDQHPLSVFEYYAPAGSRFCFVEIGGKTEKREDKIAAQILTVGNEIGISGLVAEAVAFVTSRAKLEGQSATGTRGAASATGYQGAASATGTRGAASATGYQGAVMGSDGNALFAVERDDNDDILSVACGIVGRDGVKAGVWYVCAAGKLVSADA